MISSFRLHSHISMSNYLGEGQKGVPEAFRIYEGLKGNKRSQVCHNYDRRTAKEGGSAGRKRGGVERKREEKVKTKRQ